MKRQCLTLIALLLLCAPLSAGPVDAEAARQAVAAFLRGRAGRSWAQEGRKMRRAARSPRYAGRLAAGHLFSDGGTGFVLAAADDSLPPILGYGAATGDSLPPPLRRAVASGRAVAEAAEPVAPMLATVRHQGAPYNAACPRYRNDDGTLSDEPCVVGCVATALEEIITYYRRPVLLRDTLFGWTTDHYDIADVLPGTEVDTRLIRDNYDLGGYTEAEADAVARLSYYCGVAARMDWGPSESGARVSRLVEPLKRAFGWGTACFLDSYRYEPQAWNDLLRREMQARRPVLYTGYVMTGGGHAFVLDGLDENGLFHVNWGYGGAYDGYFRLDVLNFAEPSFDTTPEGWETGFHCNQQALLLHPDAVDLALPDSLSRTGTEVVVDSLRFELPPAARVSTPVRLFLRNVSERALTTPLSLFANLPSDTTVFEQGRLLANSGITLAPGERKSLRLHALFSKDGPQTLRVTPDDEQLIFETAVDVAPYAAPALVFGPLEVAFPESGTATARLRISNAEGAGRAGQRVAYCLFEGTASGEDGDTRHFHYVYIPAGEELTDTVAFHGLQPGAAYTLLVRSPWAPVAETTFHMPAVAGIADAPAADALPETWHRLDGRPVARPDQPGIYLRRRGGHVEKTYVK